MVRRSACRGLKSVEARTISSPTRHSAAFSTSMELLPASAVFASLVQEFFRLPCRFSVPPESMMPRSPMPIICSSLTLLVRVMVALCVKGLASVPTSSSPCTMTHSVVSSRSDLSAKVSLPLTVRPPSAGGLTSRITSLPLAISTFSPATGTFLLGQLALSDQRVALAGCAASTPAIPPTSEKAGTSSAKKNGRYCLLIASTPVFPAIDARSLVGRRIARESGLVACRRLFNGCRCSYDPARMCLPPREPCGDHRDGLLRLLLHDPVAGVGDDRAVDVHGNRLQFRLHCRPIGMIATDCKHRHRQLAHPGEQRLVFLGIACKRR